jgi:hypothetical protein
MPCHQKYVPAILFAVCDEYAGYMAGEGDDIKR